MAPPAAAPSDPFKDLFYFLGILLGIMLLWYFMGGREKSGKDSGPFLKPPIETGVSIETKETSEYKNKIEFSAPYDGRKGDALKEYILAEAPSSNTSKINITGWKLTNSKNETVTISQGADLPQVGEQNSYGNIYLSPGEKAYITTGSSPLGFNFHINKCTGYFNQQLPFYPALPKDCPNPAKSDTLPSYVDNACIDYLVKNTKTCEAYFSTPSELSEGCSQFISEKINYTGCVNEYKNDGSFYKNEWRIFLGKGVEMWNDERETIIIRDNKGNLVDSLTF